MKNAGLVPAFFTSPVRLSPVRTSSVGPLARGLVFAGLVWGRRVDVRRWDACRRGRIGGGFPLLGARRREGGKEVARITWRDPLALGCRWPPARARVFSGVRRSEGCS